MRYSVELSAIFAAKEHYKKEAGKSNKRLLKNRKSFFWLLLSDF